MVPPTDAEQLMTSNLPRTVAAVPMKAPAMGQLAARGWVMPFLPSISQGTTSHSNFTQLMGIADIISTIQIIFKIPRTCLTFLDPCPSSKTVESANSSVVFGSTVAEHHRAGGFDVQELSFRSRVRNSWGSQGSKSAIMTS